MAQPLVAMGMVAAPAAALRRDQVRQTMMRYEVVRSGRMVFMFVLGRALPTLRGGGAEAVVRELTHENKEHKDMLVLDAIDGPAVDAACSCGEKTVGWVQYALKRWPLVRFIAKTEDDTYVQLDMLMAELERLSSYPMLVYGYMTLGVQPIRPTRFPERKPSHACVTQIQRCERAKGGTDEYTTGCFLGDLETKSVVPGGTPVMHWWSKSDAVCGMPHEGQARSTMAPYPTGPLAVFGADAARAIFFECEYVLRYMREAREWNRRTRCSPTHRKAHLSLASTLCDTILGHFVSMCNVTATIAHSTRTKSHHYMWRAAGLGWFPPSNLSLAVHFLKVKPNLPSGPNNTVGGEWEHTHRVLSPAKGSVFPPLLYRMNAGFRSNSSGSLLEPLNSDVFSWYEATCADDRHELRAARYDRAVAVMGRIRGARPHGMSDAIYLGGVPKGWGYSGCNPSRFSDYPTWPPRTDRKSSSRCGQATNGSLSQADGSEAAVRRAVTRAIAWIRSRRDTTNYGRPANAAFERFVKLLEAELKPLKLPFRHPPFVHVLNKAFADKMDFSRNLMRGEAAQAKARAVAAMVRALCTLTLLKRHLRKNKNIPPAYLAERNNRDNSYSLQWV
ncbi:hypothetical protein AB1Y20_014413 [Prymnesium parvum]|uniref:Hexosyltransferase n=1 Tax=Prymnesium parvum TaxID=97485 RepID=A0AB34IGI8_PRYPA